MRTYIASNRHNRTTRRDTNTTDNVALSFLMVIAPKHP